MSTLKYCVKISRPMMSLIGGLTAWIVALLSNGPTWVSLPKVTVGVVMFLSVFSASIWHYGARHDVYAKKHWDPVYVDNPVSLILIGGLGFLASIFLAALFLPIECTMIAFLNAVTILLYAKKLDQYWPIKNLVIAAVCTTPILMGWLSGHRLNPIVPPLILSAFTFYFSREILKDIVDREANRGKRFTMVMDLGVSASLKIAGVLLVLAVSAMVYAAIYLPTLLSIRLSFVLAVIYLFLFSILLLAGKDISKRYKQMDIGVGMILFCLLFIRVQMY